MNSGIFLKKQVVFERIGQSIGQLKMAIMTVNTGFFDNLKKILIFFIHPSILHVIKVTSNQRKERRITMTQRTRNTDNYTGTDRVQVIRDLV